MSLHPTGTTRSSIVSNGDIELEQLQSVRSDRASERLGQAQRWTRFDSVEKGATAVKDGVDSIAERECERHAACREMRATGLSLMRRPPYIRI